MKNKRKSPLFITGTWRCGSTLISRMMNSHSDLNITYDTAHFMRFAYDQYNPIDDLENARKLIMDISQRVELRYNLKFSINDVLDGLNGTYTYSLIYDAIMNNFLLKQNCKTVWGEKTNLAWTKIPNFLEMFPQGRVIHMIRDPRAVLSSWKKFTNASENDYLDSIINSYDSMQKALKYVQEFSKSCYVLVMYEHLVSNSFDTMNEICNAFDIVYEDKMINASTFENMIGEEWKGNTIYNEPLDGISNVMVNRWQSELEEWEIVLTEVIMGDFLEKFGYKKSSIKKDEKLINQALKEVQKSELSSQGLLKLLLTQEGMERYPTDPLVKDNWAKTLKKK